MIERIKRVIGGRVKPRRSKQLMGKQNTKIEGGKSVISV